MTPKKMLEFLRDLKMDASIPGNKYLSKSLLYKNLDKYIRITMSKSDNKEKGEIETFRNLVKYSKYLKAIVETMESELTEKGVEYYFPEDEEKVVTVKTETGKVTSILPMKGSVDWQRALRQRKNEEGF